MLAKIAWGNVRRTSRDYLVYLLTLTLAVTVFYTFNTIAVQMDIADMDAEVGALLGSIMSGLTIFLAAVMGFLMVYASNFIMRRRKKEFGLYQVFGMSRGQVARIMALETLFVSLAALVLGILLGLVLSQIMTFFTAVMFRTQIANFHFFISPTALIITAGCLVAIFLVTLIFNLRVVARAQIVDLMSAGRVNEAIKVRNPWVAVVIFVAGTVAIVVAYMRLLRDGLPLDGTSESMNTFYLTTALVVAGTILVFFGLSGFLLRALQSARGLYWRGLNMVTLRQLAAKVNTVSLSMAVIAMILFLAVTSVTSGMSIASAFNDTLERSTPVDYSRVLYYFEDEVVDELNAEEAGDGEIRYAAAREPVDLMEASALDTMYFGTSEATAFDLTAIAGDTVQVDVYDATPRGTSTPIVTLLDLCEAVDRDLPSGVSSTGISSLSLMVVTESVYNEYLRFRDMDEIDLGEDGYVLLADSGNSITEIYNAVLEQGVELVVDGQTLHPVQDRVDEDASVFTNSQLGMNTGTIVLPDELVERLDLPLLYGYLLLDYAYGVSAEEGEAYIWADRAYGTITDEDGAIVAGWGREDTRLSIYESAYVIDGLVSYLAIYIGFVLVVACAAILAIQQLSGVADASGTYRVLSELGASERDITRSMLVQQVIFFVFPLLVGIAHALCALTVVVDFVEIYGGFSIGPTVCFTGALFLVAYGGYFVVTHLMSRGIVADATQARHAA